MLRAHACVAGELGLIALCQSKTVFFQRQWMMGDDEYYKSVASQVHVGCTVALGAHNSMQRRVPSSREPPCPVTVAAY